MNVLAGLPFRNLNVMRQFGIGILMTRLNRIYLYESLSSLFQSQALGYTTVSPSFSRGEQEIFQKVLTQHQPSPITKFSYQHLCF
ncbi:unnamed protein product [Absidia cylindrospora]